jgi:hypothetical protein
MGVLGNIKYNRSLYELEDTVYSDLKDLSAMGTNAYNDVTVVINKFCVKMHFVTVHLLLDCCAIHLISHLFL